MENMYNISDWCIKQEIVYRTIIKGYIIFHDSDKGIIKVFLSPMIFTQSFIHEIHGYNYTITETEILINEEALGVLNAAFSEYLRINTN